MLLIAALLASPGVAQKSKAPGARLIESSMSRSELQNIMERGPQRFIATLRVGAHLEKGRFLGFRIKGFTTDGPLVNSRSILAGDTILRVNKEPVERPEQFMRAWETVKSADHLEVLLLRDLDKG